MVDRLSVYGVAANKVEVRIGLTIISAGCDTISISVHYGRKRAEDHIHQ